MARMSRFTLFGRHVLSGVSLIAMRWNYQFHSFSAKTILANAGYSAAVFVWLATIIFAACTPAERSILQLRLPLLVSFDGRTAEGFESTGPLSDICFDQSGNIYTLNLDSGVVSCFNAFGKRVNSFRTGAGSSRPAYPAEAIALHSFRDSLFVVSGREHLLQAYSRDGELLQSIALERPLGPGDTTLAPNGAVLHCPESMAGGPSAVVYDRHGAITCTLQPHGAASGKMPRVKSFKDSLARGEIPDVLASSVLLAADSADHIYVLHRTRPLLQCFHGSRLLWQQVLSIPELPEISEAIRIRNRLLKVPKAYIPFSYWSDIVADAQGNVYILLALQTHHTIYRIDARTRGITRLLGRYGKGHLLAVTEDKLAVADAAKGIITLYALPAEGKN